MVDGAICTFLDITERKRAYDALQSTQAELRALNLDLENQAVTRAGERALTWAITCEMLLVMDLVDGSIERLNPAWENVLGWGLMEMEGHRFDEFLHPEPASWAMMIVGFGLAGTAPRCAVNGHASLFASYNLPGRESASNT